MVATPDPKYHTEGEISHLRIARIAGLGLLIAISSTSQALGASGELRVEAGGNPDFLDPALARDPLAWQIMGATQGGLVAFRRAGGTPGTTVVPDLATALPVVSPNGLTLKFTLRDDVRFGPPASRVALPSDVKSSLERMLILDSRGTALYTAIDGASAVIAGRTRQLSGVVADDAARTVTISLTRRDPTLVQALALPFASVVPKGTRAVDQTVDPPAGLGPYAISAFDPDRRIVLTANPGYVARYGLPAGHAAGITIRLGFTPRAAAAHVAAGDADYSVMPIARSATRRGGYAAGATTNAVTDSATAYVAIDPSQAPFTDPGVRRAVGLALDRSVAAAAITTGARAASRMIPPGTPGNRKGTRAPDLRTARALVSGAGATGTAVTLWTGTGSAERAIAPAVRDALSKIGLVPIVKALPKNSGLGRAAPRAAIATAMWTQTLPDGSDAYAQLLGTTAPGTPATPPIPVISSDAALRSRARSAANAVLGTARDSAWAQVDASAVADGRVVPVATPV
ncbi:MAG: ABC transporter substrate-binding protein, partial [Actinomycetota bacterium]|nr:ABC transporter substrate-binding protein [Actinomycetota bacterium]